MFCRHADKDGILMISTHTVCCRDNNELLLLMTQEQFSLGEISVLLYPHYEETHSKRCEGDLLPVLQTSQDRSSHISDRVESINTTMLLLYGTGYSSFTQVVFSLNSFWIKSDLSPKHDSQVSSVQDSTNFRTVSNRSIVWFYTDQWFSKFLDEKSGFLQGHETFLSFSYKSCGSLDQLETTCVNPTVCKNLCLHSHNWLRDNIYLLYLPCEYCKDSFNLILCSTLETELLCPHMKYLSTTIIFYTRHIWTIFLMVELNISYNAEGGLRSMENCAASSKGSGPGNGNCRKTEWGRTNAASTDQV